MEYKNRIEHVITITQLVLRFIGFAYFSIYIYIYIPIVFLRYFTIGDFEVYVTLALNLVTNPTSQSLNLFKLT